MPGLAAADHYGHGYKKHRHHGGHGYRGKHVTHYYRRDNSNEKLLIGLLVGGIAGYAIRNAHRKNTYNTALGYPPTQAPAVHPAGGYPYSVDTCLQEREYQTTVVVGGKNVPADVRACLQPDVSWRHGPATPDSY